MAEGDEIHGRRVPSRGNRSAPGRVSPGMSRIRTIAFALLPVLPLLLAACGKGGKY
jgi:hypothetical protein